MANVPEGKAGEIKPGDKASFPVESYPSRSFEATVGEVQPIKTTHNTTSYAVALDLDTSKMEVVLPSGSAVTAEDGRR